MSLTLISQLALKMSDTVVVVSGDPVKQKKLSRAPNRKTSLSMAPVISDDAQMFICLMRRAHQKNQFLDIKATRAYFKSSARRVYDIAGVMTGLGLIQKKKKSLYGWLGVDTLQHLFKDAVDIVGDLTDPVYGSLFKDLPKEEKEVHTMIPDEEEVPFLFNPEDVEVKVQNTEPVAEPVFDFHDFRLGCECEYCSFRLLPDSPLAEECSPEVSDEDSFPVLSEDALNSFPSYDLLMQ